MMTAQSLELLNSLCLLLCLQERSHSYYKSSAKPWTTELFPVSRESCWSASSRLMACTLWYGWEEKSSFLEHFCSPDHHTAVALAKQWELRVMAQKLDWRTRGKTKASPARFAARSKLKSPYSLLKCCPGKWSRHIRDRTGAGDGHSLSNSYVPPHTHPRLFAQRCEGPFTENPWLSGQPLECPFHSKERASQRHFEMVGKICPEACQLLIGCSLTSPEKSCQKDFF